MMDGDHADATGWRRIALPVLGAVVLIAAAMAGSGSSATLSGPFAIGPRVEVEAALVKQLAASKTGKVDAVITAHSEADIAAIRRLGVKGAALRTVPILLTESLTRTQLAKLRRSPHVRGVWANGRNKPLMEDTTWITRARYAWEPNNRDNGLPPLGDHGFTGRGIHLAVIDTGVDGAHEDMENLVEFCETHLALTGEHSSVRCSPPAPGNAGPPLESGPCTNPLNPRECSNDDDGHGSHVSGTIAGSGSASGGRAHPHSTIGIAPDAKLHVYSANVGPALFDHETLAAFDDIIYKRQAGIYPTVAINNSWGGGTGANYNPGDPLHILIKEAWFSGILPIFAAGNSGWEHDTLSAQCVNPFAVCVAATTRADQIAMFSSRGRPSQNQDTNRDGEITEGSGDVPPDNHDRHLGRAYDVGVYRPTLSAPGVNINSIQADVLGSSQQPAASCRETSGTPEPPAYNPATAEGRGCYLRISGTSMATPHVTGAVGPIAEAYKKGHDNKLPTAEILSEILERSANWQSKLPGWEAEEQGSGRLDVYAAVEFAKEYPNGMKEPVLSTATPRYAVSPEVTAKQSPQFKGCTGAASWTAREINFPGGDEPSPFPPLTRYGQHFIHVPQYADRLRITVDWFHKPQQENANLYLRLWRPGVNPDTADMPLGNQTRAMADNESVGLVFTGSQRLIEVRAPESTPPRSEAPTQATFEATDIPSGFWILRVYHRASVAPGAPGGCDVTQEVPQIPAAERPAAYEYTVKVETPTSSVGPTARITEPREGDVIEDRWAMLGSKADQPPSWEGITNYEVPGTEIPGAIPEPDERKILYFHGNGPHPGGHPLEGCTSGNGNADALVPNCGPFLFESPQLAPQAAARFPVLSPFVNGVADRNPYDPNFTWYVPTTTQIGGAMTVEWWASCGDCGAIVGNLAFWQIRVFADGLLKFQKRVSATPQVPLVPDRLEATVFLPQIVANNKITIHVDPLPVFIQSTQTAAIVYYDSEQECLPDESVQGPRCDSLVRMPVDMTGISGTGPAPQNLRATDLHKAIRLAWSETAGAVKYEIHRDLQPAYVPSPRTRIAVTTGFVCTSPTNTTWPTETRGPSRCYDDPGNHLERPYYYRVIARNANDVRSLPSRVAYNMRTLYDRQVKMKVDRLYGPQHWEYASLFSDPENSWHHWWDTLALVPGPHNVWTRSFHQGIGSPKDRRTYNDSGDDS